MEKNFVYKENVDWNLVKKKVYKKAENAVIPSDTYPAIQLARSLMKEEHGFFFSPSQVKMLKKEKYPIQSPVYRLIEKSVAYISLFTLIPAPDKSDQEYVTQVQTAIRKLDSIDLDKWIIDLRENQGGNMWPMLLGLGPLLDEGCVGFFIGKNRKKIPWQHKGNTVKQGNYYCLKDSLPVYKLKNKPKIAILIGNNTASSGEATAIAFSGQQNVRFFGQNTAGLATGTYPFLLSDGACLLLPIILFSNRLGQVFDTKIIPDEITDVSEDLTNDPTIEAAISWLKKNPY